MPPVKPSFWPELEWELHTIHWPGPGPINLPAAMNGLLAALSMHTMSYYLEDQREAQTIRSGLEEQMVQTIRTMSQRHDEAAAQRMLKAEANQAN